MDIVVHINISLYSYNLNGKYLKIHWMCNGNPDDGEWVSNQTAQNLPLALFVWLLNILLYTRIDTMFHFILCGVSFISMLVALPRLCRGGLCCSLSSAA